MSRKNTILIVSVLSIIGLVLRLYFSLVLPVGWDGGIFLYWAGLINSGSIPYRDFFVRDPVYIYLVALSSRALGQTYQAVSLVSIIPGAATIPIIYKATRELFDRRSGFVAAAAYSLAPTVIWYNTVFDERTLMLFLSICAFWILILGLRKRKLSYLFGYGLLLGVSIFEYRGIAIYLVTVPILFAFVFLRRRGITGTSYRTFLTSSVVTVAAAALSAGLVFFYFSFNSSLQWMLENFGFGGQQESASYFIYGQVVDLSFRTRIFDVFVREWLYLIAPAGVTIVVFFMSMFIRHRRTVLMTAGLLAGAFLVASVAGLTYFPQDSYGAYEPSWIFTALFMASLVLFMGMGTALVPEIVRLVPTEGGSRFGAILGIYWLLSTALLVALFGVPLVNYYDYFAPILTILASPVIAQVLEQVRQSLPHPSLRLSGRFVLGIAFLVLLVINAGSAAGMLLTTDMTWRNQSIAYVHDVASYIESHTSPQDQIIVGNPAVAIFAHRQEALGITQWQIYGKTGPEPFNPMPYDPFHLFPNVTEISQFMSQGGVKYIVGDNSPPMLYVMSLHPLLESAFVTNFVLETTIDGIPIYRYV